VPRWLEAVTGGRSPGTRAWVLLSAVRSLISSSRGGRWRLRRRARSCRGAVFWGFRVQWEPCRAFDGISARLERRPRPGADGRGACRAGGSNMFEPFSVNTATALAMVPASSLLVVSAATALRWRPMRTTSRAPRLKASFRSTRHLGRPASGMWSAPVGPPVLAGPMASGLGARSPPRSGHHRSWSPRLPARRPGRAAHRGLRADPGDHHAQGAEPAVRRGLRPRPAAAALPAPSRRRILAAPMNGRWSDRRRQPPTAPSPLIAAPFLLIVLAAAPGAQPAIGFDGAPSAPARRDIPPGYLRWYQAAARTCPGLSRSVPAAIGEIESDHGRSVLPGVRSGENRAGAGGPMRFLAPTWAVYGVDADGDGHANRCTRPTPSTAPPATPNPPPATAAPSQSRPRPPPAGHPVLLGRHPRPRPRRPHQGLRLIRTDPIRLGSSRRAHRPSGRRPTRRRPPHPRHRLQPGDLLFFAHNPANPATIHHAALYLGDGRMTHAPRTGDVVRIASFTGNPYYQRQYAGATRPAPRHQQTRKDLQAQNQVISRKHRPTSPAQHRPQSEAFT